MMLYSQLSKKTIIQDAKPMPEIENKLSVIGFGLVYGV